MVLSVARREMDDKDAKRYRRHEETMPIMRSKHNESPAISRIDN